MSEQPTVDTRERILQTAMDLFMERGYVRTSLRQIAETLGLSKPAVLYHFRSKSQIMVALVEPLVMELEQTLDRAERIPDRLTARWTALAGTVDVYLRHVNRIRLLMQNVSIFSHEPIISRLVQIPTRANHIIAGPDAGVIEQIRAFQAFAAIGDPLVFATGVPEKVLRREVLEGARLILGDPEIPPQVLEAMERAGEEPTAGVPGVPIRPENAETHPAGLSRRRGGGRPRVMSEEKVAVARRMYATGAHSVNEIAAHLGVSRATVYRYLDGASVASHYS